MPRDVFPRTIARGVLTGRTFASKWEYQQARARALGFPTYGAERAAKTNPLFVVVRERAVTTGQSRSEALGTAQRLIGNLRKSREGEHVGTPRGREMRAIIQNLYDEGLWAPDENAAAEFYE